MEQLKTIFLNQKEYKLTETAFLLLSDYLRHIHKIEKKDELISEIEIQISIILDMGINENRKSSIIEKKDVEEVISVLKENRNIKYSPPRKFSNKQKKNKKKVSGTKRKFKRIMSKNILGGVCAGIAEKLNIDPVLVRLIFVFGTFFRGFLIPVYIILWIVIPSDKQI
jgi:phage shock protein PspC (stress-responsive transcriptional regulator)